MIIAATLATLSTRIEKARKNSPLAAARVTLLGACKSQPESLILEAAAAGVTDFGENRVQEAEAKWQEIKKRHPHLRLHLIGPLQTNKVKDAVELFDVIQTVDRMKLVDAIVKELERRGDEVMEKKSISFPHPHIPTSPHPQFYIQVNTGEEKQKAGVLPGEADALITYCKNKLPIVGLMCVPPADQPPAPHFALLKQIAERNDLRELSMGMSEDFETAVRMGSSCVRLGRALFGERSA